ncbi:uncharacterized protein BJX67DRAFT_366181 [Aspergillus lucknowensis]|uniref:Uncharacterized protein n=1 Tax=Aspergillus lucknowensis TaxID=176173 RepID=A0ABR4LDB2_9EURO
MGGPAHPTASTRRLKSRLRLESREEDGCSRTTKNDGGDDSASEQHTHGCSCGSEDRVDCAHRCISSSSCDTTCRRQPPAGEGSPWRAVWTRDGTARSVASPVRTRVKS